MYFYPFRQQKKIAREMRPRLLQLWMHTIAEDVQMGGGWIGCGADAHVQCALHRNNGCVRRLRLVSIIYFPGTATIMQKEGSMKEEKEQKHATRGAPRQ